MAWWLGNWKSETTNQLPQHTAPQHITFTLKQLQISANNTIPARCIIRPWSDPHVNYLPPVTVNNSDLAGGAGGAGGAVTVTSTWQLYIHGMTGRWWCRGFSGEKPAKCQRDGIICGRQWNKRFTGNYSDHLSNWWERKIWKMAIYWRLNFM